MSFSFGFSGEDVEEDDAKCDISIEQPGTDTGLVTELQSRNSGEHSTQTATLITPKVHTIDELKQAAEGSQGSCGIHREVIQIPRRSLFDIRTQLMAEANLEDDNSDTLLSGLEHGDLTSGFYEGGFKTWECALDLASLTAQLDIGRDENLHVIELGAGSAIPSLVLLQAALKPGNIVRTGRLHLTFCDYNHDVLRLCTAPNVFLVEALGQAVELLSRGGDGEQEPSEQEIEDIDTTRIAATISRLQAANVTLSFVSGAWGTDFVELVGPAPLPVMATSTNLKTLILASETIYSPATTSIFTETLITLLRRTDGTRALIAAKKVYFGVGGGVQDFVSEVQKRGGQVREVLNVSNAGVGRIVLEVTA